MYCGVVCDKLSRLRLNMSHQNFLPRPWIYSRKRCFMVQGFTLNMLWVSFYVTQRVVWYFYLQSLHGKIFLLLSESVRACDKKKFIFWLLASPYILWLSGDRQLWCSITVELFHSFLCIVFFILDGPNYESRCDRSALRLLLSQGFREMRHCVACSPFLLKTHKPLNSNFATVQSKVMKLRYSLEDSSVSHPQPNLRYSTVGLPLHPRGCLLRACEAQWTEFQWAVSFFCLSVRTYRVHIYCKDLAQAEMLRCLFSSATSSVFHSLSTVCSLYFPSSAFVPLSLLCSLWALFPFSAILSSLQRRVPCTNQMTGQP